MRAILAKPVRDELVFFTGGIEFVAGTGGNVIAVPTTSRFQAEAVEMRVEDARPWASMLNTYRPGLSLFEVFPLPSRPIPGAVPSTGDRAGALDLSGPEGSDAPQSSPTGRAADDSQHADKPSRPADLSRGATGE